MHALTVMRKAGEDFLKDDCLSSGAAIAFYTVFSLPPLLTLVLSLAVAAGFTEAQVIHLIKRELGVPLSPSESSDERTQRTASSANDPSPSERISAAPIGIEKRGFLFQLAGVVLLLVSASGVFGQLQYSLNKAWEVTPDPQRGGWHDFLMKRLLSMGLVLVLGFILLVSLLVTATMEQILRGFWGAASDHHIVAIVINECLAVGIATLLFAAIFQILPDARIPWSDVWIGALFTALLFAIGKAVIGWYLTTAQVGADWGASAVSVVGVLVWVYYSSLIVLFGAELTQVWSQRTGKRSEPEPGAVVAIHEERLLRSR